MKDSNLKIIPLGGLGEVGRNMMLYEYENTAIIVDCGSMFPENDMLGIDYIIPDFQYLRSRKDKIRGIIFTHGHEDHIGAIHHLIQEIPAPVYATALTIGLV
jgi:ribonuclease J